MNSLDPHPNEGLNLCPHPFPGSRFSRSTKKRQPKRSVWITEKKWGAKSTDHKSRQNRSEHESRRLKQKARKQHFWTKGRAKRRSKWRPKRRPEQKETRKKGRKGKAKVWKEGEREEGKAGLFQCNETKERKMGRRWRRRRRGGKLQLRRGLSTI